MSRGVQAVALSSAGVGCLLMAGGAIGTSEATPTRRVEAAQAAVSESYWTPDRMRDATPEEARAPGEEVPGVTDRSASRRSTVFHGVPTVGALFFRNGNGDHYCTASVIDSRKRNLLITAAHCIHGGKGKGYVSQVAFVPGYDGGRRPYGIWTAKLLAVDWGWTRHNDPDLDFGFVAVKPRYGHAIAAVVGSNRLATDRGFGHSVLVVGYPAGKDHPIYCRDTAERQARYQLRFDCAGFTGGTSGSPWLLSYNAKTETGSINGVIGGYQRGGAYAYISYSPYFDEDVRKLRDAADRAA